MTVRDLTILGCSSQQPTRLRNHGAYLLRWNNEGFLFDPGEGTQRQFIFAETAPTCVTRILISHFHGDHCLGLGSMLMRLNLDNISHEVHCYYPASGKVYFDRLRYGTAYHDHIKVVEHPVQRSGFVHDDGQFRIEAFALDHGIDNLAWRISEKDSLKFIPQKLAFFNIQGPMMKELIKEKQIIVAGKTIYLDEVSYTRPGDIFTFISDTRPCEGALLAAQNAKLLVCESTYLNEHQDLAWKHYHLTVSQAAQIAKEAGAQKLILTHFSARYPDLSLFKEQASSIFANTEVADDFKRYAFEKD